jgi:hypothetical protein
MPRTGDHYRRTGTHSLRSNMEIGESAFLQKDLDLAGNDEDLVSGNLDPFDSLVGFVSRRRTAV